MIPLNYVIGKFSYGEKVVSFYYTYYDKIHARTCPNSDPQNCSIHLLRFVCRSVFFFFFPVLILSEASPGILHPHLTGLLGYKSINTESPQWEDLAEKV